MTAGPFVGTGWILAQAVFEADILVQNAENSDGPNLGVPMNPKVMSLAAIAVFACTAFASAHHSFAMFDSARTVTVQGTVTQFRWTNPHSWLHVAARDERDGQARRMGDRARLAGAADRLGHSRRLPESGRHGLGELPPEPGRQPSRAIHPGGASWKEIGGSC